MPRTEETHRAFIALVPDQKGIESTTGLCRLLREKFASRGRFTPPEKLHLTLAFLGECSATKLDRIEALLSALPPFRESLILDRLGMFRGTYHGKGLLWISGHSPEIEAEAGRIRSGLDQAGIAYSRDRFKLHATLCRNWEGTLPELALRPIVWNLSSPRLILSIPSAGGKLCYVPYDDFKNNQAP